MTQPPVPQHRVRIEVSTSVKGVHTYSCTVERADLLVGDVDITRETVLEESTALVADLDTLYPKEG